MGLMLDPVATGGAEPSLLDDYARMIEAAWVFPDPAFALTAPARMLLARYLELLNRWNRVHSLTAISDPEEQIRRHIVDALVVWPHLARRFCDIAQFHIADVGSGMGVPGVVWSIVMPSARVDLFERQQKKLAFLRHVVAQLGVSSRVRVMAGDVRQSRVDVHYEVISSRAFAALPEFLAATMPLCGERTVWAAMVGRLDQNICKHSLITLARPNKDMIVDDVISLNIPGLMAERHLVWIRRSS
jgi:16S rRNA (guanine527-N7)-methyltransferase